MITKLCNTYVRFINKLKFVTIIACVSWHLVEFVISTIRGRHGAAAVSTGNRKTRTQLCEVQASNMWSQSWCSRLQPRSHGEWHEQGKLALADSTTLVVNTKHGHTLETPVPTYYDVYDHIPVFAKKTKNYYSKLLVCGISSAFLFIF